MNDFDYFRIKLIPIFQEYGVRRVLLFGSWAKDEAGEKSDVDLYVDSGLRGMRFVGLIEDVSQALGGRDVDMLDATHVEPGSVVEKEIERTGVLLY